MDAWGYDPINDEVILWGLDEYFYFYKNGKYIKREKHRFFNKHLNNSLWHRFLCFNHVLVVPFIETKHYFNFETTPETPLLAKLSFPNKVVSYMGTWDSLFKNRDMSKHGQAFLLCSDTEGKTIFSTSHTSYKIHKINPENNKESIFGVPCKSYFSEEKKVASNSYWNNSMYYEDKNDLLFRTTLTPKNKDGTRYTILQIYKGENLKNEFVLPYNMNSLVYVSPDLELWFENYKKSSVQTVIYRTKLVTQP